MTDHSTPESDLIIAIDGPAGSGKSTTARLVARELQWRYLDTGAMYRAVTLLALRYGVDLTDEVPVAEVARDMHLVFDPTTERNRVVVNGEDVTDAIRAQEITRNVSRISAFRTVREAMVAKQKEIGAAGRIVAEGRDTTTVVFPSAAVKIYLQAEIEERARRRLLDYKKLGVETTVEEQVADLARRDKLDTERPVSPLRKADDAVVVDTTSCTIEEQVAQIVAVARERTVHA